jgi:hypothetical protein
MIFFKVVIILPIEPVQKKRRRTCKNKACIVHKSRSLSSHKLKKINKYTALTRPEDKTTNYIVEIIQRKRNVKKSYNTNCNNKNNDNNSKNKGNKINDNNSKNKGNKNCNNNMR